MKLAKLTAKENPLINQIVQNDIYADDFLSGENTDELDLQRADQLETVLNQGGFFTKTATFRKKEMLQETCLLMIALLT